MGATEEQMQLISDAGISHVAYVLVLYSFAFVLFLFVNMLLHLYDASTATAEAQLPVAARPAPDERSASRQLRDAEEFELAGLMSEEGLDSCSTLGKHGEGR
jgi:hypothetical protein